MYETKDFNYATVFKTLGIPIKGLRDGDKPKEKYFIFDFSNQIQTPEEIIQQYWDNTLLLDPKSLFSNMKELKSRIYEGY